jgi:IS5 family transposase
MSFFTHLISSRVPENNRLRKLDALVDWTSIRKILTKKLGSRINPVSGVKPYDSLCMFKALLLQTWHSLSDPELEDALRVRFDFILFCRFEVEDSIPDETTICRFRNRLVELGLDNELLVEINNQLEQKGVKVKRADGAVIDATIIQSAAKPGKQLEQIPEDRKENEMVAEKHETTPSKFRVRESRDPDARWLKKGRKTYFGYKMFVSTESNAGFVEHVEVTSANQSEVSFLPTFLEGMKNHPGRRVYADKGYASKANREFLKNHGLKDGLMEKGNRGKELSVMQKIKNKLISKKRYIIEQTFGTLKRMLLFTRARYCSLEKVRGEAIRKALCLNLIKATNKIRLNLQNQEKLVIWR